MGRFAGLNIVVSALWSFSWEYFCSALASGVYYLTIAKCPWENFCGTLKNCENHEGLAQQTFSSFTLKHENCMYVHSSWLGHTMQEECK